MTTLVSTPTAPSNVFIEYKGELTPTRKLALQPITPLSDYFLGNPFDLSFVRSPRLSEELYAWEIAPKDALLFGSYLVYASNGVGTVTTWERNVFLVPLSSNLLRIRMHHHDSRYFIRGTIVNGEHEDAEQLYDMVENPGKYPWLSRMFGDRHNKAALLAREGTMRCGLHVFHTGTGITLRLLSK